MADTSVNDTVNDLKTTANHVGNELGAAINNGDVSAKAGDAKQAIKDGANKYTAQATDKVRTFAEEGKARASGALEQVAQLLTDAAGQVDDRQPAHGQPHRAIDKHAGAVGAAVPDGVVHALQQAAIDRRGWIAVQMATDTAHGQPTTSVFVSRARAPAAI